MTKGNPSEIKAILKGIKFKGISPIDDSFDSELLAAVTSKYVADILTSAVLREVIHERVFEYLLKMPDGTRPNPVLLSEQQLDELARLICADLDALPAPCEFVFILPKSATPIEVRNIRHNISVGTIGDDLQLLVSSQKNRRFIDQLTRPIRIDPSDVVLRVKTRGYVGDYHSIRINTDDPLFLFKVISALYQSLGLFTAAQPEGNPYSIRPTFHYYVFKSVGPNTVRLLEGDSEDFRYITTRKFEDKKLSVDNRDKQKLKSLEFERINKIASLVLTNVKGNPDVASRQQRIRNGCYWFYEAYKTLQDYSRLTYIVTGFDALLGNALGTKEAKAEIIAQGAAENIVEESFFRKEIINLYELRNDVVHGSKTISSLEIYSDQGRQNADLITLGVYILQQYLKSRIDKFTSVRKI